MKINLLLPWLLFAGTSLLNAQSVGIGTTSPDPSSQVDISSTSKGLLIPRVSTIQRKAISNPAAGLMVYDTDKSSLFMYDGVQWMYMSLGDESNIPPVLRMPTDNQAYFAAGISVSTSGNYAVVGTYNGANLKGSAFIYFRSAGVWRQQAKLEAGDATNGDNFGYSVSVSGNYVVVGADGNGAGNGAAYVFSRNGTLWTQQAKLTASDGASGDKFGRSVSISGDYLVVGAPGDDISVTDQGSAYVFYRGAGWFNNQAYQAKLVMQDPTASDQMGTSVAISGDYLAVGAPYDDINFTDEGSAMIYGRVGTNWPLLAKLSAPPGAHQSARMGITVAMDGNYVIVGAPYDLYGSYAGAGTCYIFFGGNGWTNGQPPQAILNSPDPFTQDNFGLGVAISGDYAIVGISNDEAKGETDAGSCRLYKRNGIAWNFVRSMYDEAPSDHASFGYGISMSGANLIIGIPNKSNGVVAFLNVE